MEVNLSVNKGRKNALFILIRENVLIFSIQKISYPQIKI